MEYNTRLPAAAVWGVASHRLIHCQRAIPIPHCKYAAFPEAETSEKEHHILYLAYISKIRL